MARVTSMAFSLPCMKAIRIRRPVRLSKLCQCTSLLFRVWMMPPSVISASCRYHILYHGCNNWANQISCFEVNKCDIYLQTRYIILIYTSRRFMFTVDLDDRQWLQCMCTQIPNAFTINKVGMDAGVVVNGGASCDVDGRILSTLSTYWAALFLKVGHTEFAVYAWLRTVCVRKLFSTTVSY